MSRKEDFEKSAIDYCEDHSHCIYFEAGAEYGYKFAVDKACEWLREHLGAPAGIPQAKSYNDAINELTTEFRKGME
jgi:hypothetical protein